MKIQPFKLERYFAAHEFSATYLMCASDCEALSLSELLATADADSWKEWLGLKLGYTESQGHHALREEIARLYENIKADEVLTVTPEEGIYIAMNTLLKRGDHVVVTFPGYQSLYEIAISLGCEVSKWTPREENGWIFKIDDLGDLIRDKTRLIVVNFPHNPTGATISRADLEMIAEIAEQKGIVLFSDEMYRFLEHDAEDRLPSACDLSDGAVSLFGMSKSFALAGLRIGWLTTKNAALFGDLASFKDYTTICASAPSEILAIMGLRAKGWILKRNLGLIKSNLKLLDTFFGEHADLFEWNKPKAGPIGFPRLKSDTNVAAFCANLLAKKGVLLLPADQYGFEGNNFRVGFARRNMPKALEKLREYVDENPQLKEIS
ncbi:MAG: aminotransferase class I/II-fold pyridoxal phosphate-dependent enzyme [Candidatus Aminicenantales bacterium]